MPAGRTLQSARPRQDPVSCQLCRMKKLKCDRQRPCANCVNRGMECNYRGEPPSNVQSSTRSLETDMSGLNARLQRLENAVFGAGTTMSTSSQSNQMVSTAAAIMPSRTIERAPVDEDRNWLQSVGVRFNLGLTEFDETVAINLHTIESILAANQGIPRVRDIDIPTYDIAIAALEAYARQLDAVHHIMHIEDSRRTIEATYARLHSSENVEPGALFFILALCATAGLNWAFVVHGDLGIFPSEETALKASREWARHGLLALEQARSAATTGNIQALQGCIMLFFLFFNWEGLTFRVRMLHTTAIAMAHDLGLHKTDLPSARPPDLTRTGIIESEVRRKIWWHIASTDWMIACVGGGQENMYSIHPHQMHVKIPRNITLEDLQTKGPDFQRSITEPTVMSYYLHRIKLAAICREAADVMWQYPIPEQADYSCIQILDDKFKQLLQELPHFLRYDLSSAQLREEYGTLYDEQTHIQSVMINLIASTRRCMLHLPFLIRANSNKQFAFSRRVGLQSARVVFDVRRFAKEDNETASLKFLQLGGFLQHVFTATIVLVMDLCVNKDDDDESRLAEVKEALEIIEEVKQKYPRDSRFYDSLIAVLEKHHVKVPSCVPTKELPSHTATASVSPYGQTAFRNYTDQARQVQATTSTTMQRKGSDIANAMDSNELRDPNDGFALDGSMLQDFLTKGSLLDASDWDALFTDIDMGYI